MSYFSDIERDLVVIGREEIARDVVRFDVASPNGRDLPAWTPGAHIDVILAADGDPLERQYSLCGDAGDRSHWSFAVLREEDGRGGSVRVHALAVGDRVRVRGPRSHFAFEASPGGSYRFVAGGIGITPLRPMIAAARAAGARWTLEYAGRGRATMAFAAELEAADPARVHVHAADEGGRLDLAAMVRELAADEVVYACGPQRLLADLEVLLADRPDALHVERFEAKEFGDPVWPDPFEVELELTGVTVTVTPDVSVLDAVRAQAPEATVLSSCRRGTCGTCEVPVVEGAVEHRDSVLTPLEQEGDTVMMICVSRAAGPRLVLDL
ncbi:PDR/VanB family oxidoreductase [Microbacterium sp. 10M-3C3]|uniref:PDR/VanB family oxidoreductase n=1 Tax=Microbacterium sp. 10M-3C3 TaxID=2483401 RepID=UPI000F63292D|nr:PDR/VanB family oxidoreductase [Microbacterium sp. 10M-3C3]